MSAWVPVIASAMGAGAALASQAVAHFLTKRRSRLSLEAALHVELSDLEQRLQKLLADSSGHTHVSLAPKCPARDLAPIFYASTASIGALSIRALVPVISAYADLARVWDYGSGVATAEDVKALSSALKSAAETLR